MGSMGSRENSEGARGSSLAVILIGALIGGFVSGWGEAHFHLATFPGLEGMRGSMLCAAALVNHVLALGFGGVAWLTLRLRPAGAFPGRAAFILSVQLMGLLWIGVLYWVNDIRLAAPLLAPRSLQISGLVTGAAFLLFCVSYLGLRVGLSRTPAWRLRPGLAIYGIAVILAGGVVGVPGVQRGGETSLEDSPPNVVLISLDTQRADRLGAYGYPRPTSPTLDSLADAGLRFSEAFSTAPSSAPGHATMLTGMAPWSSGVHVNGQRLPAAASSILEHLQARGYRTAGFLKNPWLAASLGFSQGATTWFNERRLERNDAAWARLLLYNTVVLRALDRGLSDSDMVTTLACDWLRRNRDAPFCLFYHLVDPHQPYDARSRFRGRFADPDYGGPVRDTMAAGQRYRRDAASLDSESLEYMESRYDEAVLSGDSRIGRLVGELRDLGLLPNTLVVVTADHGENLSDAASYFTHDDLHRSSLHVPLIFFWEGVIVPGVGPAMAGLQDVVPSICEALGVDPPTTARGRSLLRWDDRPKLTFREGERSAHISEDATHDTTRVALRTRRWNLIRNEATGTLELFDVARANGEHLDVASAVPDTVESLEVRLDALIQEAAEGGFPSESGLNSLDDVARRELEALGYL